MARNNDVYGQDTQKCVIISRQNNTHSTHTHTTLNTHNTHTINTLYVVNFSTFHPFFDFVHLFDIIYTPMIYLSYMTKNQQTIIVSFMAGFVVSMLIETSILMSSFNL